MLFLLNIVRNWQFCPT